MVQSAWRPAPAQRTALPHNDSADFFTASDAQTVEDVSVMRVSEQ